MKVAAIEHVNRKLPPCRISVESGGESCGNLSH